ncbi:tyrosine-type recombinase/integrase [Williamsia herbipolensis]|uniref:tyrosine-type recombinase/integrase n=1 Tax=Williamsia herbipolensis TaxID=1603258 RepID=UPI0038B524F4
MSRYYVALALIIASCCLRSGETATLRWSDITYEAGYPSVAHTPRAHRRQTGPEQAQTKRLRRRVPMSAAVVTELRAARKRQAEDRLHARSMWAGHDDMVLTTKRWARWSPLATSCRVVEVAAKAARFEGVGAHTLRHSAVTACLEAGF